MIKNIHSFLIFGLIILISALNCIDINGAQIKKFKKNDKFIIALPPEKIVFEQRECYKCIADYLSEKLDLDVRTVILSSYGEICDAISDGRADAAFFGSFSYVLTHAKAGVEPIARPVWLNGSSTYSGYIFVRKDSGIRTFEDMRDKRLVLVHKATTAGFIFPLTYFKKHGIKDMGEYLSKVYFAGSHDASAWAVYIGEGDIGSGKNHIFNSLCEKYPDFKEQMLVLAESQEVPSNGLAVSKNLDPALKKRLKDLLLDLNKTEEGRSVLKKFKAIKFIETRDEDYAFVYQMAENLGIDLTTYPYKD